jgi:hypothetical protein
MNHLENPEPFGPRAIDIGPWGLLRQDFIGRLFSEIPPRRKESTLWNGCDGICSPCEVCHAASDFRGCLKPDPSCNRIGRHSR